MFYTTKTSNSLPASRQRGVLGRFCFCSTQSYNRYSYVLNNPLKYTDPSGWIVKGTIPEVVNADDTKKGGGGGTIFGQFGFFTTDPGLISQIVGILNNNGGTISWTPGFSILNGQGTVTSNGYTQTLNAGYTYIPGNVSVKPFYGNTGTYNNSNTHGNSSAGNVNYDRGGGVDMNNATAGGGYYNIGLNPRTPKTGFFNNTLNYVNNHKLDIIGTFGGAAEYELGRRLSKPINIYQKIRLATPSWSKYSSKIEPFASEYLTLSKYAKGLKWGGGVLGGIGIGMSFYGLGEGIAQKDNAKILEKSLDIIMGGVGFIPAWGWAASGTYFLIAKPLYNNYISKEDTP